MSFKNPNKLKKSKKIIKKVIDKPIIATERAAEGKNNKKEASGNNVK